MIACYEAVAALARRGRDAAMARLVAESAAALAAGGRWPRWFWRWRAEVHRRRATRAAALAAAWIAVAQTADGLDRRLAATRARIAN